MINKKPISSIIISEEVQIVNKIKETNYVLHDNEIIKFIGSLQQKSLKIFEIALSCIDVHNPPKDNTIRINKKELFKLLEINNTEMYSKLKKDMILFQSIVIDMSDEEYDDTINLTSRIKTPKKKKEHNITIKFSEDIMPYIIGLKGSFTKYQLRETIKLKSKYSIILYKWLVMNYNMKKNDPLKYKNKDKPIINVEDLRKMTGTNNTYKDMSNFEKRVLKEPIKEINEKTSIKVSYKTILKNGKIDSIQFIIEEKKKEKVFLKLDDVVDETSMIEFEQQQQELKEKEYKNFIKNADNEEIYNKAIKDKKIKEVINVGFIKFDDEKNIVKLYKEVLPIYERIDLIYKGKARSWLFNHLNYQYEKVRGNIIKDKIVHYLKESARNIEQDILSGRDFY